VTDFYDRDVQPINRSFTGGCHEPSGTRVLQVGLDLTDSNSFAELLDATSEIEFSHLRIQDDGGIDLAVASVVLETDQRIVVSTEPFFPGVSYIITVTGLAGVDQLLIVTPETASLRYLPVVSFTLQIQPVFDQSRAFVGCHAADVQFPPGTGVVLHPGVSLISLANVPSDQISDASRVLPGSPDASYLIKKLSGTGISGDRMPVFGPFLPPSEIQVFRL
jgi:hypothetical protein